MNKRLSFPVWFYVVMALQGVITPVLATDEIPNRPPLSEVKALEGFERSVVQEYSIHFGNARLLTGLGSDSGFFGGGDSHEILWEPGVVRLNSGGPGGYAAFFHCLSGADKEERHEMDFLRPFHAAIKDVYQPCVMGAVIRAKGAGPWHVELLRGEGATQQEVGRISFEDYSESEYTETYVDLSGIAEPVKRLTILAADGGDIYLDRLEFVVQLPKGMTETEYAFLVSLAQLLRCHDPQTGLVRDQAQNPIEEGGNRHVTPGLGWVALAAALGADAGFIEPAAAAALAEQTIGTLLSLPALETGWLPHFTGFDGEGVLVPCPGDKDEYSTIDTALAYLSAYAAAAMLGLEDEQDALYAKIQALDFTAVTNSHGEIHHGFNRDGQLLPSTWLDFGGETLLMVLLGKLNDPNALFTYEKVPKPGTIVYQGNGFILELAPLLLRQFGADPNAGPDACGVDWHALRQELLTAQQASVGTGAFIAGRSSCEIVPDASDTDYLASGAFEYTENWLAPHYAALVSGLDIKAAPDRIAAARSLGFMPVLSGPVESIFYDEHWNLVRVHRVQTALNAWFNTLGYYAACCLDRARENALHEAVAADPALGAAAQALFANACTPPWFTFAEGSGANLPWMTTPTDQYGWDVGANPWGGDHAGYSTNLDNLAADLDRLKDCCASLVRVFIFCDFRTGLAAAPPSGEFAFDDYVFADMDALVTAAADKGLKLMPVLLDFTLIDGKDREGESDVGEHPEFITTHKDGFIQLLAAFVERYSDNSTIFAWDLINEPEVAFELAANAGGAAAGFPRRTGYVLEGTHHRPACRHRPAPDPRQQEPGLCRRLAAPGTGPLPVPLLR